MSRIVINLTGRKRTGKETVYRLMLPYVRRPEEFQFATPLKKFCMEVLGLTHEQCYGSSADRETPTKYKWAWVDSKIRDKYGKAPEEIMTARSVLQVVGTDLMRQQFYHNIWAEAGIREAINSTASSCIFTDGRFIDELGASRDVHTMCRDFRSDTLVVRLYRQTGLDDGHDSETALDKYDAESGQRAILPRHRQKLYEIGYREINPKLWEATDKKLPFDYLLDNNDTIDSLKENVLHILKTWEIFEEPHLS